MRTCCPSTSNARATSPAAVTPQNTPQNPTGGVEKMGSLGEIPRPVPGLCPACACARPDEMLQAALLRGLPRPRPRELSIVLRYPLSLTLVTALTQALKKQSPPIGGHGPVS